VVNSLGTSFRGDSRNEKELSSRFDEPIETGWDLFYLIAENFRVPPASALIHDGESFRAYLIFQEAFIAEAQRILAQNVR
jgi:hypothetical protein